MNVLPIDEAHVRVLLNVEERCLGELPLTAVVGVGDRHGIEERQPGLVAPKTHIEKRPEFLPRRQRWDAVIAEHFYGAHVEIKTRRQRGIDGDPDVASERGPDVLHKQKQE